jgi:hypothetical protein
MTVTSGTVYVDTDWAGTESGTRAEPFNTLSEAEGHFSGTCDAACLILLRGATDDTTAAVINFDNLTFGMTVKTAKNTDWSGTTNGFYGGTATLDTAYYLLKPSDTGADGIIVEEDDITIDGIQIEMSISGNFQQGIGTPDDNTTILRCRVRSTNGNAVGIGRDNSIGGNITIDSCLIINFKFGIDFSITNFFNPTINIYNNTIYGCDEGGIRLDTAADSNSAVFNIKNNVIGLTATASADFELSGFDSGTINYDTNAVDDTASRTNEIDLSPGTEATDHDSAWTTPGTTAASIFTIQNTSSVLSAAGISIGELVDITGKIRSTLIDVGAFDIVTPGASFKAALNTNITDVDLDTLCHIVFQLDHFGALEANFTAQLEYNVDSGGWNDVTASSTNIRSSASANITDGLDVPQLIGSGDYLSTNAGYDEVNGASGGANLDWPFDQDTTETNVQFAFVARSADLSGGEVIQLRIKDLDVYTETAQLTIGVTAVDIAVGKDDAVLSGAVATITVPSQIRQAGFRFRNDGTIDPP